MPTCMHFNKCKTYAWNCKTCTKNNFLAWCLQLHGFAPMFVPFWEHACVGVQCRQLEALRLLLLLQRDGGKERTQAAQERVATRGTSTHTLSLTGAELSQSESPYRKKAGSSRRRQTHSPAHRPGRNNTRASVSAASAQQLPSGSGSCLDLLLCAKNNKDQDNVGTDMQHSQSTFYVCMNLPAHSDRYFHCETVDERGLGVPVLWSVLKLPPG